MKKLLLIYLLLSCVEAKPHSGNPLFNKLSEVNSCWLEQQDVFNLNLSLYSVNITNEQQMTGTHLMMVEQVLRSRNTAHLNKNQKMVREQNLNRLHEYWITNRFPVNNKTALRNPVFIDDYNTFCAVGYLIKTSGHEPLARKIAANTNLAYLRDMQYNDLDRWMEESGLTLDELAWIQPGYTATNHSRGVGQGVDGNVYAITGNDLLRTIYVAGSFSMADATIPCNNIVAVQYQDNDIFANTFTPLGNGLNGTVWALYADGTSLYAGGHFDHSGTTSMNNIARWNGNTWEAMGNINGTVNAIAKYNNQVYAGGDFTFSIGTETYHNIAVWNGSAWLPVCNSINGTVHALTTFDNKLVIGGAFTEVDTLQANHIFTHNGFVNEKLGNGVPAAIKALYVSNFLLLAGGDLVSATSDTFGIAEYINQWGGQWQWKFTHLEKLRSDYYNAGKMKTINAIADKAVGGIMRTGGMYISLGTANYDHKNGQLNALASFDSTVYAIYKAGDKTFFGGAFKRSISGSNGPNIFHEANGLAVLDRNYTGIAEQTSSHQISFAPNPLSSISEIHSAKTIRHFSIFDMRGQLILEQEANSTSIRLERTSFTESGLYLIQTVDESGDKQVHKLSVN